MEYDLLEGLKKLGRISLLLGASALSSNLDGCNFDPIKGSRQESIRPSVDSQYKPSIPNNPAAPNIPNTVKQQTPKNQEIIISVPLEPKPPANQITEQPKNIVLTPVDSLNDHPKNLGQKPVEDPLTKNERKNNYELFTVLDKTVIEGGKLTFDIEDYFRSNGTEIASIEVLGDTGKMENGYFVFEDSFDLDTENNVYPVEFMVTYTNGRRIKGTFNIIQDDRYIKKLNSRKMEEGVVLTSWWHDDYEKPWIGDTIQKIHDLGAESVSILATWYQNSANSLEIKPSTGRRTPSDEGVEGVIKKSQALGLRTVLKPHVDLYDNKWRGKITHTLDEDWRKWFESYTDFILHYAQMAERDGVDSLIIGTELKGTSRREEWKQVIKDVRAVYSGKLLYCANHDEYQRVIFWDDLDGVGISAYFPKSSFQAKAQEAKDFAEMVGKPLYILEIGYPGNGAEGIEAQAEYYQGVFDQFYNQCEGLYLWHITHDLVTGDPYHFLGKKAEVIVNDYYHRSDLGASLVLPK